MREKKTPIEIFDDYQKFRATYAERLAKKAARKVLQHQEKGWDRRSKSDAVNRVKYQCGLTQAEAAEVEALRQVLCPNYSKYGFVRLLLLAFIEVGQEKIAQMLEQECDN